MDGTLLISRRTYSLSKHKPVVEWKEVPYSIDTIKVPKNFELRLVNADMELSSISRTFPELQISYTVSYGAVNYALHIVPEQMGCTDIAWYAPDLRMGFIFKSHANKTTMMCTSIEDLKKELV